MIIGIEGVSCVGKSLLAAELGTRLSATVIPCYFHCATDPGNLPPLVAPTAAEQLDGLRTLLGVEQTRRERALDAWTLGRHVVLDRTVDTLVAHAGAVSALHGFGIRDEARRLACAHAAAVPDVTLLLSAPYEVRRRRAASRPQMPELLYAQEFTQHFLRHFHDPITPRCIRLDGAQQAGGMVARALALIAAAERAALRSEQAPA